MSRYVINRKDLDENIEIIKKKAGVPIIGVVKGNGYGFGIKELTSVLLQHGIKTFAVTEVTDIPELNVSENHSFNSSSFSFAMIPVPSIPRYFVTTIS